MSILIESFSLHWDPQLGRELGSCGAVTVIASARASFVVEKAGTVLVTFAASR
jgi:hypothetical protein